MSEHVVSNPTTVIDGYPGLRAAVTSLLREPVVVEWRDPNIVYVFTPDLTASEQSTFADLVATFRSHDINLTPADYAAIKPFLATGRTFVQQSQSQYMALTQAQRDRMNFDNITALWRVIFRLLRD